MKLLKIGLKINLLTAIPMMIRKIKDVLFYTEEEDDYIDDAAEPHNIFGPHFTQDNIPKPEDIVTPDFTEEGNKEEEDDKKEE